jgi:riboflavin kinase / FMN adenylyltransferase
MKVFRSLESYEKGRGATATIGTFDGVHLGHQKILGRLMAAAQEIEGESVVISFHPHPRLVLFPEDNPLRLLQDIEEKVAALEALGIDKVLLIPFTRDFSRLTSHQFIMQVLVETVATQRIVIGYDHHFGKNRTGGLRELQEGAGEFGFDVEEIPAEQIDHANVSSTKIRHALSEGDLETARKFLGYDYQVSGKVIQGEQLGRQLGYPTANILPHDPLKLIPAEGVYLSSLLVDGQSHYGMLNVGKKPTVGNHFPVGIEINLFDFDRDIYHQDVRVQFLEWIRPDKKFASLEELKAAIAQDQQACLSLIAQRHG